MFEKLFQTLSHDVNFALDEKNFGGNHHLYERNCKQRDVMHHDDHNGNLCFLVEVNKTFS